MTELSAHPRIEVFKVSKHEIETFLEVGMLCLHKRHSVEAPLKSSIPLSAASANLKGTRAVLPMCSLETDHERRRIAILRFY